MGGGTKKTLVNDSPSLLILLRMVLYCCSEYPLLIPKGPQPMTPHPCSPAARHQRSKSTDGKPIPEKKPTTLCSEVFDARNFEQKGERGVTYVCVHVWDTECPHDKQVESFAGKVSVRFWGRLFVHRAEKNVCFVRSTECGFANVRDRNNQPPAKYSNQGEPGHGTEYSRVLSVLASCYWTALEWVVVVVVVVAGMYVRTE